MAENAVMIKKKIFLVLKLSKYMILLKKQLLGGIKMADVKISDSIVYIGVDDKDIDLFESQYEVPNGVSYNSYLILDEKIAVMDTADMRVSDKWFENLEKALNGAVPDYLIVSHLEPDHAGNIKKAADKYPGNENCRKFKIRDYASAVF